MADDHYVQQAFSRGFTDSEGALHLYNKTTGEHRYPVYPATVFFAKNYETGFLRKALRAIESSGMEGITLLRERQYDAMTSEILQGLLVYLIAHLTRPPHHLRKLGAVTPEECETEFLLGTGEKTLGAGKVAFMPVEFQPSAVALYLTDNPVCVISVGEGQALIAFPIASHQMIAGVFPSPHPGENTLTWQNRPWMALDDLAEKVNAALFKQADQIVVCQQPIICPISQT